MSETRDALRAVMPKPSAGAFGRLPALRMLEAVALRIRKTDIRPGRPSRTGLRVGLLGLLALFALSLVFQRRFTSFFEAKPTLVVSPEPGAPIPRSEAEVELAQFADYVVDHVQATFERELGERGQTYAAAKIAHFTDRVRTPCGQPGVVRGTFYCPAERRVYVDLGQYRDLRRRFGADGDFAETYVLAHALGHHLQTVQGVEGRTRRQQARWPSRREDLEERLELQADCYAGVWSRIATERELLHPGDLEAGMDAAAQLGEALLSREDEAQLLEPGTHGTRARRVEWIRRGFENGRFEACDTFARETL